MTSLKTQSVTPKSHLSVYFQLSHLRTWVTSTCKYCLSLSYGFIIGFYDYQIYMYNQTIYIHFCLWGLYKKYNIFLLTLVFFSSHYALNSHPYSHMELMVIRVHCLENHSLFFFLLVHIWVVSIFWFLRVCLDSYPAAHVLPYCGQLFSALTSNTLDKALLCRGGLSFALEGMISKAAR